MWDWLDDAIGALGSMFGGDNIDAGGGSSSGSVGDSIDAGGGWNPDNGGDGALSKLFETPNNSLTGPNWGDMLNQITKSDDPTFGKNAGTLDFASAPAPADDQRGVLAKFLNNVGVSGAAPSDGSIGKIDWSDPRVLSNMARLGVSGLQILNSLSGGNQNVGKKSVADMRSELASPFNQWQPQFQAAADQMANRKYADRAPQALLSTQTRSKFAKGGGVVDSNPQFISEGALARAVRGPGGGQDDIVPARLAPGEWVGDADFVSAVGDGNSDRGIQKLDELREKIRSQKRAAPAHSIPPKTKPLSTYMKGA